MNASRELSPSASGAAIRKVKRIAPIRGKAFGILNPYGDFWTWQTFETAEQATLYVMGYWKAFPKPPHDISRFKVVPVKVTVSAIAGASDGQVSPGRTKS